MVKCSICGKYITENFTWDHVYPRELSKWTNNVKVKKLIKSKYNRAPAHYKCNYRKQDLIPNVDKLHISNEQKNQLKSIYKKIEVYIELHEEEKASLLNVQGHTCYWCGRFIKTKGILRRIDPSKERRWNNACIVCNRCNDKRKAFIRK